MRRLVLPVVTLLAATAAMAQANPDAQRDPNQMMADQLVLLMQQALASAGMPSEDQLLRANVLLGLATELAPEQAELWRMKAELAELREDVDGRRAAVARVVQLDPTDDSAQLDLILDGISRRNTVEERLAVVERVLDAPSGRGLSSPLRSRLASYAASAARELGDEEKFARRLAQAMELDPANSDATRMAFDLARRRGDSTLHQGTAAINWARSQPADPEARDVLARLFLREGLYQQAAEQVDMAVALAGQPPTGDQLRLWVMGLAMAGRTDGALNLLNEVDRSLQRQAGAGGDEAGGQAGDPAGGVPTTLPPQLELLRLAILSLEAEPDTIRPHFEQLRAGLQPMIEAGDENARRELALAAAMFSQDPSAAEGYLGETDEQSTDRRLVRGWAALRDGRVDEAREHLGPLAEEHALAALGVALAERDPGARASMLQTVRQRDPAGMAGMLAVLNLEQMGATIEATPVGRSLQAVLRETPARVWSTDLSLSPWLAMRLIVDPGRVGYLEPVVATVTLQNLSGVPLTIGRGGTIPEQMLVSVRPSRAGEPLPPLPPVVIDIGRRLTLQTSERRAIDFRLDHSTLGDILAMNPSEPVAFEATAIIDPRQTERGTVRPGAAGSLDHVRAIQLINLPPTTENVQAWLEALDSADPAEALRATARLLRALATELPSEDDTLRRRIGDELGQRAKSFGPLQLAWAMRFLPPQDRRPLGVQRMVELAQRSPEPIVRLTYLEAHVTDPADPAMTAALRETDPAIGEYARALRETLRARQAERERLEQEQEQLQPGDAAGAPAPDAPVPDAAPAPQQ